MLCSKAPLRKWILVGDLRALFPVRRDTRKSDLDADRLAKRFAHVGAEDKGRHLEAVNEDTTETQEEALSKVCRKPIQKSDLSPHDTLTRVFQSKPIGSINLRKFLLTARLRRPFHRKCVTSYGLGRAITFESPSSNYFSARLLDLTKRYKSSIRLDSRFLFEFSLRSI
jgi:hypothetical protein